MLLAAVIGCAVTTARAQASASEGGEASVPAAPIGGPVELAVFGGVGGPVGPAGVSAAYLPAIFRSRLAVGLGLGRVGLQSAVDYGRRPGNVGLRLAPFIRGHLVDRPGWRVGLGLSGTRGDELTHHDGTADDGAPAVIFWRRDHNTRLDGSVMLELVRGDVALRLEAGLGRVYGNANCEARFGGGLVPCRNPVLDQPRTEPEITESPSAWRPSLQLALAVRPGGPGPLTGPPLEAAAGTGHWRVVLAATNARKTDFLDDEYEDGTTFDAGIEADYVRQPSAGGFRWGAGARYSYGTGPSVSTTGFTGSEHVAYLPFLLGWAWRARQTGEEVEFLGGIGPGMAAVQTSPGYHVWAVAAGLEAAVNYIRPLPVAGRWALVVGLSGRVLALWAVQHSQVGAHAELPVHVGLRF